MKEQSSEPLENQQTAVDPRAPRGQRVAKPRVQLLAKLLLLGSSLFLVCLVAELTFRFVIPVTDTPSHFWDPLLGPRPFPRQSGRIMIGDHIRGRYHFNSQGWNHPRDYEITKTPDALRVCMVGDSYVEAMHVDVNEAMFCVAEREMSRPDRLVEWYAFGRTGWGVSHAHEAIRHYVLDYRPDLVIFLFVQNDPSDTSAYLRPLLPYDPRYWLDGEGRLRWIPGERWERRWGSIAIEHLAIVRYFLRQRRLMHRARWEEEAPGGFALMEQTADARNDFVPGLSTMNSREREEKTWALIEALLASARDECAYRGSRLAVAFRGDLNSIEIPFGGHPRWPDNEIPPQEEDPYCLRSRLRRMGPEQLEPICKRLGLPYLDLTEPLREAVARDRRSHVFPDDDHYSTFGHEAAGHALAAWANELLSTTQPAR